MDGSSTLYKQSIVLGNTKPYTEGQRHFTTDHSSWVTFRENLFRCLSKVVNDTNSGRPLCRVDNLVQVLRKELREIQFERDGAKGLGLI